MNTKRLATTLFLLLAIACSALAQSVQSLPFSASPPPGVVSANCSISGTAGQATYYYWVVAQYPVGSVAPTAPSCTVTNAPNTLSGGNFVVLNWNAASSASSLTYAVLRSTTASFPGTGTDAVTTSTSSLTANDQSNSLSAYTFTNAPPVTFTLQLNNRDLSTPAIRILDNNSNSAFQVQQTANGAGLTTANLGQLTTTAPYTTFTTIAPPSAIATNATTDAANTTYVSPIFIPTNATLNGACLLNGATVGTDKHIFVLWNAAGALVANSAILGTTTATASKYQCLAFPSSVLVNGPQTYWIGVMSNGTTDIFQTYAANSVPTNYFTGTVSQTFGSGPAAITGSLPSAFNANQGPLMMVY